MMSKEEKESFYILSSHHQQLKEECAKYRRDIQLITKYLVENTDFNGWFTMEALRAEKEKEGKQKNAYSRIRRPI